MPVHTCTYTLQKQYLSDLFVKGYWDNVSDFFLTSLISLEYYNYISQACYKKRETYEKRIVQKRITVVSNKNCQDSIAVYGSEDFSLFTRK